MEPVLQVSATNIFLRRSFSTKDKKVGQPKVSIPEKLHTLQTITCKTVDMIYEQGHNV